MQPKVATKTVIPKKQQPLIACDSTAQAAQSAPEQGAVTSMQSSFPAYLKSWPTKTMLPSMRLRACSSACALRRSSRRASSAAFLAATSAAGRAGKGHS